LPIPANSLSKKRGANGKRSLYQCRFPFLSSWVTFANDAEARFAVSSSFLASQILESGYKRHKKNLWLPFEKNIGRHTVSDVSGTLKVVEVTATRQRERRLKSNQFD
jgi:hypothetical protein